MTIGKRLQEKAISKFGADGIGLLKTMDNNLKILEKHMVVMTENQVEFEKYLKDIQETLNEMNKK